MANRGWVAAGVTLGCVGVLLAFEAVQSARDLRIAREGLERTRRLTSALEVTERKEAEFEHEVQLLAAKQAILDRIMPAVLGSEEFVARYRDVVREVGLTIEDLQVHEDRSDTVHRADIRLTLSGPAEAMVALRDRTRRGSRLATWSPLASGPPARVRVSVYAYPPALSFTSPPCHPPEARVWLWPFSARMAAVRAEWAGLCATADRLHPIQVRVDAFETARGRFDGMVTEIERLRAADTE